MCARELSIKTEGDARSAREWIFDLLKTRQRHLDYEETAQLFKLIHLLHSSVSEEKRIKAENMTFEEKRIARDYLNNDEVHAKSITACNSHDAQRVFEGMITFRVDILPEFIQLSIFDREIVGYIFEDHLAKELHFLNDFLPDGDYFDALRAKYETNLTEYDLTD